MNLEWTNLVSEKIDRIAYFNNELYVQFKEKGYSFRRKTYIYENVPYEIYQSILNKDCISQNKNLPSHGATLYQLVQKDEPYTWRTEFL